MSQFYADSKQVSVNTYWPNVREAMLNDNENFCADSKVEAINLKIAYWEHDIQAALHHAHKWPDMNPIERGNRILELAQLVRNVRALESVRFDLLRT